MLNLKFLKYFQWFILALLVLPSLTLASITDEILDRDDLFTRLDETSMQQRMELFEDQKLLETKTIEPEDFTVKRAWKCEESDLLVCLYRLGKEGIYELSAEQFFAYFPKSEYDLIAEYFDYLRISKQARFVKVEFFLKDVKQVKFSLFGKEYPRVAIKHRGKMVIEKAEIANLKLISYPRWITKVLPHSVKKELVDVDENLMLKLQRWSAPSVTRRVTLQNIYLYEIEFVQDQWQGYGASLNEISVVNMETDESLEKIFLLKGTNFLLPTMKGLRKNTLFTKQLSVVP